jgi:hypothetical protein
MTADDRSVREYGKEGDEYVVRCDGPSWPVPHVGGDRELWIAVNVHGIDTAIEIHSEEPISLALLYRLADELVQVATDLEAEEVGLPAV